MNEQISLTSALIWPSAFAGLIATVILGFAVLVTPADAASAHANLIFTESYR